MTDKVQKIREEVERLLEQAAVTDYWRGYDKALKDILSFIDSMQEEPVSEFMNTESMIESYKQRLISQANGMKNSPLVDMCLASYKHGINEILDTLNLSNVQRTVKNWKEEPIIEVLNRYLDRVPDEEVLKTKMAINEWFNVYFPKLQEEPVSIDFEQELYKAFGQVKDFTLGMQIAKWFFKSGAKWQAEKDLELTWEDVKAIFLLVQVEWSPNKNEEEIYQEVLKRFKEIR